MNTRPLLEKARTTLNNALAKELKDQGHFLTGALEASINNSSRVIEGGNKSELIGWALDYAQDLETGKKRFGKNHLQELFKYFILRGLPQNEAMSAAVRTYKKHNEEGMPTEASKRFSKTGERKHFIDRTWKENEQKKEQGRLQKKEEKKELKINWGNGDVHFHERFLVLHRHDRLPTCNER